MSVGIADSIFDDAGQVALHIVMHARLGFARLVQVDHGSQRFVLDVYERGGVPREERIGPEPGRACEPPTGDIGRQIEQ